MVSYPLSVVSSYLRKYCAVKLIFEDFVFLILTWANLLLWRGAWNLCLLYFLPSSDTSGESLGAWVSHIIGTIGLMALQLFNTVGLHNIERDCASEDDDGMDNIKYLRHLLQSRWNKQVG
jgi:Fuseless